MRAFTQLAKEFAIPFLLAIFWVVVNATSGSVTWIPANAIFWLNIFMPAFFFTSWAASQWFRVRKQQRVDDKLSALETSLGSLISRLEERTKELVSHITGGDSYCFLSPLGGLGQLMLINPTPYPVFNLSLRLVDIDAMNRAPIRTIGDLDSIQRIIRVGTVAPNGAVTINDVFPIDSPRRNHNIFYTALNGETVQFLRVIEDADGNLAHASKVFRGETTLYESVYENFPRDQEGAVVWTVPALSTRMDAPHAQ
jgi:hypothetical protein